MAFLFFSLGIFLIMCLCECFQCMCEPTKVRGVGSLETEVTGSCEFLIWVLQTELGSLKK